MHQKQRDLQKRFEGFLQTPNLWNDNVVEDIDQFELSDTISKIDVIIDEKQRLGKYVEELVFYQLMQTENTEVLTTNIQIQKEKLTLGELDCLLKVNNKPIHLEIVYKFYVIDETQGNTEISHCIGPNRKDSLRQKLTKLKNKQLPLLYSTECENYLSTLDLKSTDFEQRVLFKAQLFLPYNKQEYQFSKINQDCVVGFFINKKELENFLSCKFYIPVKKDWLIIPHSQVNWLSFESFKTESHPFLKEKFSPLFWLKHQNGEIKKCFLVWW